MKHRQDRQRDLHRVAGLFGLDAGDSVAHMLPSEADGIAPTQSGVEQDVEPDPLARADLPSRLVSERTKAALKAAKTRGVKLGRHGAEVLAARYREEARQRAKELEPVMRELVEKGYSRNRIAEELNERKVPTPRGGRWDHSCVRNVMHRLAMS